MTQNSLVLLFHLMNGFFGGFGKPTLTHMAVLKEPSWKVIQDGKNGKSNATGKESKSTEIEPKTFGLLPTLTT